MSKVTKVTILGKNILVKGIKEEQKDYGGLILPDVIANCEAREFEVVQLGLGGIDDEGEEIEFTVKVGDVVLPSKYDYNTFMIDEEEYMILTEENLLAIVSRA